MDASEAIMKRVPGNENPARDVFSGIRHETPAIEVQDGLHP